MTCMVRVISRTEPIAEAARMMKTYDIGMVVVYEGSKPVGLITDRDLVIRCMAESLSPSDIAVGEVMTRHPIFVHENDSVEEAMDVMFDRHIGRLLVKNDRDELVGVLSIADVATTEDLEKLGELAQVLGASHWLSHASAESRLRGLHRNPEDLKPIVDRWAS